MLTRMLDRFAQDLDADGLLISQPGRRLFMDWAPVSRNEPNAIYNLHFLLALQLAVDLARQQGATTEAARWQAVADRLRRPFAMLSGPVGAGTTTASAAPSRNSRLPWP